jgi:putative membrane protein insertion efficiency factor
MLVAIVLLPVFVYRWVLSPMKKAIWPGASCRYLPTCSEYAVEAVKTRGIAVGIALAIWRILRCNPFVSGGHDPVPPRRHRHGPACQEQH